jgi:hypothetical protein
LEEEMFYIKDQKTASSDKFGIAPFDANKKSDETDIVGLSSH